MCVYVCVPCPDTSACAESTCKLSFGSWLSNHAPGPRLSCIPLRHAIPQQEVRSSQRPSSQYGLSQDGESEALGSRPGTASATSRSRPSTAVSKGGNLQSELVQPGPERQPPRSRPSTAPTEQGGGSSGKAGVPRLTGLAAFDASGLPPSEREREGDGQSRQGHAGAQGPRAMYGVHVEYPPDYDFNVGGTGLEPPDALAGWRWGGGGQEDAATGARGQQTASHAGSTDGGWEGVEGMRRTRDNEVRRPASAIDARPFRVSM